MVEERERNRERQQHEQVEMEQREGPAEVEERQHEQQAQGQPDVERVYVFAEQASLAARQPPLVLDAGPLLEHTSRAVEGDLALLFRKGANGLLVVGRVGRETDLGLLVVDHQPLAAWQFSHRFKASLAFRAEGAYLSERVRDREEPARLSPVGRQSALLRELGTSPGGIGGRDRGLGGACGRRRGGERAYGGTGGPGREATHTARGRGRGAYRHAGA